MNVLLKIDGYILYHVYRKSDKPGRIWGEHYTFAQEQPDNTYQFLCLDGTFQYPVNWMIPYFSTLDEIIAAFKKYITIAELLKLKFNPDIAQIMDD